MILYSSSTLHQVLPVTREHRISSFFWMESMVRGMEPRQHLDDNAWAYFSGGAADEITLRANRSAWDAPAPVAARAAATGGRPHPSAAAGPHPGASHLAGAHCLPAPGPPRWRSGHGLRGGCAGRGRGAQHPGQRVAGSHCRRRAARPGARPAVVSALPAARPGLHPGADATPKPPATKPWC